MILLYHLLEEHRGKIIQQLLKRVPREIKPYQRVSRPDLKESVERLFEAFLDFMVTSNADNLKHVLQYTVRKRHGQKFPISAVQRAMLILIPAIRATLEECLQDSEEDPAGLIKRTMAQVERATFDGVVLLLDVFQEYVESKLEQQYKNLVPTSPSGLDSNSLVVFKA